MKNEALNTGRALRFVLLLLTTVVGCCHLVMLGSLRQYLLISVTLSSHEVIGDPWYEGHGAGKDLAWVRALLQLWPETMWMLFILKVSYLLAGIRGRWRWSQQRQVRMEPPGGLVRSESSLNIFLSLDLLLCWPPKTLQQHVDTLSGCHKILISVSWELGLEALLSPPHGISWLRYPGPVSN